MTARAGGSGLDSITTPVASASVRERFRRTGRDGDSDGYAGNSDGIYDLVSIQFHALKGAQLYEKFLGDADGHQDVQQFFRQCAEEDARRANQCHDLIGKLTGAAAS